MYFTTQEWLQLSDEATKRGTSVETLLRNSALAATPPRPWTSAQLRAIQAEATASGHLWTIEELTSRHLPLFWNEEWVRARLQEGRTSAEIAELSGGWPVRTASHYILNTFEIRLRQPQMDEQTKTYIRDQVAAGRSRLEVANEVGVSRHLALHHSRGNSTDRDRQFEDKAAKVGKWPATTQEIAAALFDDNGNRAPSWCRDMMKSGRLIRIKHGLYDRVFRPT